MKTFDLLLLLNQQWVWLITSKCSLFGIFEVRGGIKASQSSIFNIKICMFMISSLTATSSFLNPSAHCRLSTLITSLSYLSENDQKGEAFVWRADASSIGDNTPSKDKTILTPILLLEGGGWEFDFVHYRSKIFAFKSYKKKNMWRNGLKIRRSLKPSMMNLFCWNIACSGLK